MKMKSFINKWKTDERICFLNKFSLLFQGILSCLLVLIIESASRHSVLSAISFCFGTPLTFLFNAMLIFDTLLFVYLFKRRMLVRMIISVFWLLLGLINGVVLASRVTPFNFTDLKLIGDLLDMKNSKYLSVTEEILVLVLLGALGVFLVYLFVKGPKFSGKLHRFRNAIALAACIAALPFLTSAAIDSDILSGYFGNLAQGYQEYGFVYSFTSSVVDTGMSRPANYSEETIKQINEESQVADSSESEQPNIIFVQLETFVDPDEFNFLEYSEDPTPNFHKLMEEYSSGYLTVPVVGAGTANTEFEILTGMGIQFFGLGEYPYKTVLKTTACESAASELKKLGYSTSALHNNGGNFYGRRVVFGNMGFDSFVSKEMMNITEYNALGSWPTDDILVEETEKILDASENQSDFIYTISVQSHGSYPDYQVYEDPAIKVTGGETQEVNYQWEYYINQLHEVDEYVGKLIASLAERDEKTIVVLYGDHLPTMGLEDSDMKNGDIYKTTYVTWNNFGLEKEDADLYAYQLMAETFDRLGIHEGTMFRYHQSEMKTGQENTEQYISKWEALQYDLLYGEGYSYEGKTAPATGEVTMGVEDVVINNFRVNEDSNVMILSGENFTPWSKVFVNGEKVSTEYISDTCLEISLGDLQDGATIVVNQVGSGNTIFRSSNTMTFYASEKFEAVTEEAEEISDTTEDDFIHELEQTK